MYKVQNNCPEPGKSVWLFYYDGGCGFCSGVVKGLSRLDFPNGVQWVPFQSLEKPPGGLSWDDLISAAYLDSGDGQLEEGFYAFRKLTLKILPMAPLAPLFWFPGVQVLGTAAYRWIARNRYRMSSCRIPGLTSSQSQGSRGS